MKRLAFFVSGSGTNMENLIKKIQAGEIPGGSPEVVISDNPAAPAIQKAAALGVKAAVVDRKQFAAKKDFEAEIIRILDEKKIDWILLAGFMRILSAEFVRRFAGRIMNIHPSLLPAFPGAHGIRDAYEARVNETGVTVHFVDEGVDTGEIILQKKIAVAPGETLESLEARIHRVEYEIYPEALRKILNGEIGFNPNPKKGER